MHVPPMPLEEVFEVLGDIPFLERAIELPMEDWAQQCHAVSLKLAKKVFPYSRVARGHAEGVGIRQHSWLILSANAYAEQALIVDATLWSYRDDIDGIWTGTYQDGIHHPHGEGHIINYGKPLRGLGKAIPLNREGLTDDGLFWADMVEPLTREGWSSLMNFPMQGWASREIVEATFRTPGLEAIVPIDIEGMVTNRNPQGLYFKEGQFR